jgi:hypothetical protein
MGFDGISPFYETRDELVQCGERFFGSYDPMSLSQASVSIHGCVQNAKEELM